MQFDAPAKSASLLGVTDLTLMAPIRRELIPALDSRSYESRLRLLLRALNALRVSSLEAQPTPLIEDSIARIRAIHSFRLAIVGQEQKQLVLAVTFDGGWEPYLRRIWDDLGPLLDVILCNCDGYLLAHDHSFAAYTAWVRSVQVKTEFFYNASPLTVSDLHYLRAKERARTDGTPAQHQPGADPNQEFEQAMPALVALYRLTDMYPPPEQGAGDGECLLRAALHLLPGLGKLVHDPNFTREGRSATERAALNWFRKAKGREEKLVKNGRWNPGTVQAGIIEPYPELSHACLLLVELQDAAAAHALLEWLRPAILSAADQSSTNNGWQFVNLAFTVQGLKLAGVADGTLAQLPFEFREGMAARAGILGDLRHNHPTRWALPQRNWPPGTPDADDARVELSCVHALVQYACAEGPSMQWSELVGNPAHPLAQTVGLFDAALAPKGVRILSVQALQRFTRTPGESSRDHFGFIDGISQPTLADPPAAAPGGHADRVALGDLLLGHANSLADPPLPGRLWEDSTFLVVRKLRQDVAALDAVLPSDPTEALAVKASLMGRGVDGETPIKGAQANRFDYTDDPAGASCPVHSHVRRANPRTAPDSESGLRRVPRILRRGMSYGPPTDHPAKADTADRGLVFMAYNASIAEQFEVIQAWLAGANSAGENTYSARRDPILGVALDDDPCHFEFTRADGAPATIDLASQRPFVTLEWGMYAFVPSIKALGELQEIAAEAARLAAAVEEGDRKRRDDQRGARLAVQVQTGAVLIARLRAAEQAFGFEAARTQWKIALEDVSARMSGASQAIWAAVRELHGGALRTPYGVLVCNRKRVLEVFEDAQQRYTASGYAQRMRASFGEIYLGMDRGPHEALGCKPNQAILEVTQQQGFDSAFEQMRATLARLVPGNGADNSSIDVKDIVDDVLAGLSEHWFGLPDGQFVAAGGWHWRGDVPPTCPGHFHSPSRYMFQPHPGPEASATGQRHGKALSEAVRRFVQAHRDAKTVPLALLSRRLFDAIDDNTQLTRTLIGVMMGFLPTVDGNIRGALYEWISDRSLWDHQTACFADQAAHPSSSAFERASRTLLAPLRKALQLRPVPELAWRLATVRHHLGAVDINPGEMVVVSIVAATQQALHEDDPDLAPLFGGVRHSADQTNHACPGYEMAIGVLLGMLAGLLESVYIRPTLSPMALRLSRRSEAAAKLGSEVGATQSEPDAKNSPALI